MGQMEKGGTTSGESRFFWLEKAHGLVHRHLLLGDAVLIRGHRTWSTLRISNRLRHLQGVHFGRLDGSCGLLNRPMDRESFVHDIAYCMNAPFFFKPLRSLEEALKSGVFGSRILQLLPLRQLRPAAASTGRQTFNW